MNSIDVKISPLKDSNQLLIQLFGVLDNTTSEKFISLITKSASTKSNRVYFDLSGLLYVSPTGLEAFDILPRKFYHAWKQIEFLNISEQCHQQILRYGINNKITIRQMNQPVANITDAHPVQIYSENQLIELIINGQISKSFACISIRNPDETIPNEIQNHFEHLCELKFYDAYELEHLGPEQKIKRIPEPRDIDEITNFYMQVKDSVDGFIVHCWEGKSRSPAVAMGLLHMMNNSENHIKNEMQNIRPEARPHMNIVKYFDHKFGTKLLEVAKQIRSEALDKIKMEIEGNKAI